jgi:hypothetical protein
MTYQDYIPVVTLIKDVALTIGTITTVGLGIYGVQVWKRDLVGKEVFSLIATVIKDLHKVHRACMKMRNPVHRHEWRKMEDAERVAFTLTEQWRMLEKEVYTKRLDDLSLALDVLRESLLSARVLVGSSVYAATLVFQATVGKGIDRLNDYLDLLSDQNLIVDEESPQIESGRQALHPTPQLDDLLTVELANAREAAELALMKFLHRNSIRGTVLSDVDSNANLAKWKALRDLRRPVD